MNDKTVKYVAIAAGTALLVFIGYHVIAGRTANTVAVLRNQQLATATNPAAKPGNIPANPGTISTAGVSQSVLNSGIFSSDASSTTAPSGAVINSGIVNSGIFSNQF